MGSVRMVRKGGDRTNRDWMNRERMNRDRMNRDRMNRDRMNRDRMHRDLTNRGGARPDSVMMGATGDEGGRLAEGGG